MSNYRTAPINERLRATLSFLEKLILTPRQLSTADVHQARAAGVSSRALEEAVYVAFTFGVIDRLADALGFEPNAGRPLAWTSRMLLKLGYGGASVRG